MGYDGQEMKQSQYQLLLLTLDNNKYNNEDVKELSIQEMQLTELFNELTDYSQDPATLPMFLQYCPDSVNHLLDKCIITKGIQVINNFENNILNSSNFSV